MDRAAADASLGVAVAEPDGYRMTKYGAPVPKTLAGAKAVTTEEAWRLFGAGDTLFVDVLPRPEKPPNLPEGTIWRDRPRDNIPGSIWLPNVGYGALAPERRAYFLENLESHTAGDKSAPILIYCLADCWMSWNAAKRALAHGYRNIYWYPGGTDAWRRAGHELQRSLPVPDRHKSSGPPIPDGS